MTTAIDRAIIHRGVRRGLVSLLVSLLLSLLQRPARADEPSADVVAAAEAAFDQGRQLAKAGEYAQACAKFEESQRLVAGSGTLLNLGDCYEQLGRSASAWATFRSAAAAAATKGHAEREAEARARAEALKPRLSKLRLVVTTRVEGLEVKRSHVAVGPSLWNTPIPVDPGDMRVEATAPGHQAWAQQLTIPPGPAETAVIIPALTALTPAPAPVTSVAPQPPPAPMPAARGDDDAGDTQRLIAYIVGGVGIAAVGVGIGTGVFALRKNDESNTEGGCDDDLCPPKGVELRDKALTGAHVSTGMFVVGAAALATATVLLITAPDGDEALRVAVNAGGLWLERRW